MTHGHTKEGVSRGCAAAWATQPREMLDPSRGCFSILFNHHSFRKPAIEYLGFWRFSRKKDPWKERGKYLAHGLFCEPSNGGRSRFLAPK